MSRAMCNRVPAPSAVIAVLIVLNYRHFVRPRSDLLSEIPAIVGSTLLMWAAVASALGVPAEAILPLTGRGADAGADRAPAPDQRRPSQG